MASIRVAAAQTNIRLHDREHNLGRAREWAAGAAEQGADLIVFPELGLTGPLDPGDNGIVGEARAVADWQLIAREMRIDIVTGTAIEGKPGNRRNRAYYIDWDGNVLGHHDKRRLWKTELPHTMAGDEITVVEARFGRVGLAICWDITHPETIASLAEAGAELIAVPAYWCTQLRGPEVKHSLTAEATHVDALCVTRAFENSVAIVFANAAGECFPCDPEFPKRLLGHSQVTVPFKGALACARHSDEELVLAEIDLDLLADARDLYGLGASTGQ